MSKQPSEKWARAALERLVYAIERCGCDSDEHAHYCREARAAALVALVASEPRAATPISLEEQAQPDAQDLTEEEIAELEANLEYRRTMLGGHTPEEHLCVRLLATEKRRRGIK